MRHFGHSAQWRIRELIEHAGQIYICLVKELLRKGQTAQALCENFYPATLQAALTEISRNARETVFGVPTQARDPGEHSGRQRRQGRKPASAAALGK